MADDATLPTHLLVAAAMAAVRAAGAFAYIRQRGDADRGTLLIKLNDLVGNHSLHRQIWDGERRRLEQVACATGSDAALEASIASEAACDPDLWIVEIEDKSARLFFDTILHQSAAITT